MFNTYQLIGRYLLDFIRIKNTLMTARFFVDQKYPHLAIEVNHNFSINS